MVSQARRSVRGAVVPKVRAKRGPAAVIRQADNEGRGEGGLPRPQARGGAIGTGSFAVL